MKRIYCFDIDGVLVDRPHAVENLGKEKYKYCFPIQKNIDICNILYDEGHIIKLFTSRGMSIYSGDIVQVHSNLYDLTYNQMNSFGVKFHELIMGKPAYDLLIDDKAINVSQISILL